MSRLLVFTLSFVLASLPTTMVVAQTVDLPDPINVTLSAPLLEGTPAPFSGLLISEEDALQCAEDAASVARLLVEVRVRTMELEVSSSLREEFISEQRDRIRDLSQTSWWDENGSFLMFGLGLVLGVLGVSIPLGLVN